jgi:alpha-tubulin suppressor-like RCC1 family protein
MQRCTCCGPVAGLVVLLLGVTACREEVTAPPEPASIETAVTTSTTALRFIAITAGGDHSCAIASDQAAWCWGSNLEGQVGDGTNTDRLRPVRVKGGLHFVQISAGSEHTCAIGTDELAYCWGGIYGTTPSAVPGGRRFRNVSAGNNHTCAVTPYDIGYCWGVSNSFGQLGTGGGFSLTPVRIARGLLWRRVVAGGQYTCGVTTDNKAYCWGVGITGVGVTPKPVAVPGGLAFRDVVAGGGGFQDEQHEVSDEPHACGVTTNDRAYCWGFGGEGELGNGAGTSSTTPVAVAGGRLWQHVDAGYYHSCGVTTANVAFCWGRNLSGGNGDGTTATSTKPVRVLGGIAFTNVTTGVRGSHTCALTGGKVMYCWGDNSSGQLGDGTRTRRLSPVRVAGT